MPVPVSIPTVSRKEPPAAQLLAWHFATFSVPAAHAVFPDTVYPALQIGWQLLPDASCVPQSPLLPLVGEAEASHGFGMQVADVSTPVVHVVLPDIM